MKRILCIGFVIIFCANHDGRRSIFTLNRFSCFALYFLATLNRNSIQYYSIVFANFYAFENNFLKTVNEYLYCFRLISQSVSQSTLCLCWQVDTSLAHFVCSVMARILAFTNSCLNPFALYLLSKSFKKEFNQQLCCCCKLICSRVSQSSTQLTPRAASVRSTHCSVASLSIGNGRQNCQENFV